MDGTLLDSSGQVSKQNAHAIKAARDAGIHVVFITGRPARWIDAVCQQTEHEGLVVGGNGAFVADMKQRAVIHRDAVPREAAKHAVERVLERFPGAQFAVERSFIGMPVADDLGAKYKERQFGTLSEREFTISHGYTKDDWVYPGVPVLPLNELVDQDDITKLTIKPADTTGWDPDSWLAAVKPLISDVVQVTHAGQSMSLVEVSALGVTKAKGLEWIANHYGVGRHEIAAVGDMPNDLEMLAWAGQGWAVGNAHPEVLAATDRHLPHHDDHAIAHLIESLLAE